MKLQSWAERYRHKSEEQRVANALVVAFVVGFLGPGCLAPKEIHQSSFGVFAFVGTSIYAAEKLAYAWHCWTRRRA
jgi:hypothetical protein